MSDEPVKRKRGRPKRFQDSYPPPLPANSQRDTKKYKKKLKNLKNITGVVSEEGRPVKPIDWDLVDKLLLAGCDGTEIAPHFHMHHETFYNRVAQKYGKGFTQYQSEIKSKGNSLLREVQYIKALSGDNAMLIWLGKNRLKQRDHEDLGVPPNDKAIEALLLGLKMIKESMDGGSKSETDKELQ